MKAHSIHQQQYEQTKLYTNLNDILVQSIILCISGSIVGYINTLFWRKCPLHNCMGKLLKNSNMNKYILKLLFSETSEVNIVYFLLVFSINLIKKIFFKNSNLFKHPSFRRKQRNVHSIQKGFEIYHSRIYIHATKHVLKY